METIEVIVSFKDNGVFPHIIKWGQCRYKILKVNLVHTIKEGAVRIYFFSVSDGANAFKLGFNTENLKWWIEDSYSLTD
ncbi:MAG: hypothetical protein U1C57_01465 [Candidatus Doudnabacteria bacterium]|nr:hypothetical protein [bacterium]MDZ4243751.1 hypothetical protein [Candidatus Doudnabacteria bacterium]